MFGVWGKEGQEFPSTSFVCGQGEIVVDIALFESQQQI